MATMVIFICYILALLQPHSKSECLKVRPKPIIRFRNNPYLLNPYIYVQFPSKCKCHCGRCATIAVFSVCQASKKNICNEMSNKYNLQD